MAQYKGWLTGEEAARMAEVDEEWSGEEFSEIEELVSEDEDGAEADDKVEDEFDADSDGDSEDMCTNRKVIYGKNGSKWYTKPFHAKTTRTLPKNIVIQLPGPKGAAREKTSEKDIWFLFFPDSSVEKIVTYTNEEIDRQKSRFKSDQRYLTPTNKVEIHALFGLLYLAGVLKNANLTLLDMWSESFGPPAFRCTMPKNRFEFLLNCLRFDSKGTRAERKAADKFAAIRELWDIFVQLCSQYYSPSQYVTVDEQLLSFRGRCPFKMYIPSKPDKYGIKIIMMCDAKTYYMCVATPYVGKENRDTTHSIPTYYILNLTNNIQGSNRNVTLDNWFSSCELCDKLSSRGLTMVGTMRKNKPDIPPIMTEVKKKAVCTSTFAFQEEKMLVSYVPRKNKCVVLLSSMHTSNHIDEETKKPEVVLFYNETKGGVDSFDQLCHSKTVARKTRRWPLRVFYGMLDAAAINACVIFRCNSKENKMIKRSDFLKNLALGLCEEHMKIRMVNLRLPRQLRSNISQVLGCEVEKTQVTAPVGRRPGRCAFCPRTKDRKGVASCCSCSKSLCAEHRNNICEDCKQ